MTTLLAIKLQPNSALALAVRADGGRLFVEKGVNIPLQPGDDARQRGRDLAAGLEAIHHGRAPAVVVLPRSELVWQNQELPPVPADDLPDLVHLQAQRDAAIADDGEGFDFLPLEGSEEHPYKVIAAGLLPAQWRQLRETIDEAGLKVERIIPEPLGWPELGRRVHAEPAGSVAVYAAIFERQAAVWATEGDELRLIRTVWLPEDDNAAADAAALGGELRRTLLALAQSHPGQRAAPKCVYIGASADEIAGELGATLSKPVQAVPLERLVDVPAAAGVNAVEAAPVAALAASVAQRRSVGMDLLHPRRRPAPPSRLRTYGLAGAAAAALLAFIAWQGYRNLQEPLEAAAEANATREALAPLLEDYAEDEAKAAAIGTWLDGSVNLLAELDHLAHQLRPEPLDSEKFPADQDVVLTKLVVNNRTFTVDAAVKDNKALQPIETRLRAADYRFAREAVDAKAEGAVPGYGVSVVGTLERVEPAPEAEGAQP
ncbi:MAG TPA: hypothetical protein VF175_01165 [Lacipirellula sp.]